MANTVEARIRKKRVEAIREEAVRQGACEVRWIPARQVVLDERVRLKCQVPLCDSYNNNLMCPPRLPSVSEIRKSMRLFSHAILIQVTSSLPDKPLRKMDEVYLPAKKLHALINTVEKIAFENGFLYATGLIGGCCRLCEECAAMIPGAKCRHPFRARPSMEAMGIDVLATLKKAGLTCSFPVTNQVRWTGMLLL